MVIGFPWTLLKTVKVVWQIFSLHAVKMSRLGAHPLPAFLHRLRHHQRSSALAVWCALTSGGMLIVGKGASHTDAAAVTVL
jgi:hypothetical protein